MSQLLIVCYNPASTGPAIFECELVACSFDEALLQQPPGFVAAVSGRINYTNPINGKSTNVHLPDWVANPPPSIRPVAPNVRGPDGPVPLPLSVSWQRYSPCNFSEESVHLAPSEEPDVLVIVLQNQVKSLLSKESELQSFISSISSLPRRRQVSVVLFVPKCSSANVPALYDLVIRLQFEAKLTGVQQVSNVQNLANLVANYTKSVCQRPFKELRTDARNGFSFLPSTVVTPGAGAPTRFPKLLSTATLQETEAIRSWVSRTWLRQLSTWRGLTGEITNAVASAYPTPRALYEALNQDGPSSLANLPVRRGAGVLTTETRLGPLLASRIATFFTSSDPEDLGAS
ncbi:unnamed protein product [Mesocestoides corti]|uniref:ERCC4 domain-containing protein n=1 Tax=Mesocestoides corti TaxID=53468 RepID=A0A0R3UER8_MESCO|nr:unnamed protein product [Mesocestoides corti]